MELYIDLHIHTIFSDGIFNPESVARYAKDFGLAAISITDHDNTGGIDDAIAEGQRIGLEIVPGVELSVIMPQAVTEMHILGYYIDWKNKEFQDQLTVFREARKKRAWIMIEKFHKLGIKIDEEKIFPVSGNQGSVGRLHFAKLLVQNGVVDNIKEAFNRFLDVNRPAYVQKKSLTPEQAIKMINNTGGIAVLAHPYYGNFDSDEVLTELTGYGLKGIEAWHGKHTATVSEKFVQIGRRFGLVITGGSDYHGPIDKETPSIGMQKIPYSVLDELKKIVGRS
jgi:hypothetical protein